VCERAIDHRLPTGYVGTQIHTGITHIIQPTSVSISAKCTRLERGSHTRNKDAVLVKRME
jgi:hypothetical protein